MFSFFIVGEHNVPVFVVFVFFLGFILEHIFFSLPYNLCALYVWVCVCVYVCIAYWWSQWGRTRFIKNWNHPQRHWPLLRSEGDLFYINHLYIWLFNWSLCWFLIFVSFALSCTRLHLVPFFLLICNLRYLICIHDLWTFIFRFFYIYVICHLRSLFNPDIITMHLQMSRFGLRVCDVLGDFDTFERKFRVMIANYKKRWYTFLYFIFYQKHMKKIK